jgi:hypothetical protein
MFLNKRVNGIRPDRNNGCWSGNRGKSLLRATCYTYLSGWDRPYSHNWRSSGSWCSISVNIMSNFNHIIFSNRSKNWRNT